jgi:metal-responsive CopG/Arc/MetJ family transcriptional regulator
MAKRTISFSLDTETDSDILEWLEGRRNRSEVIREALRAAIAPSSPVLDIGAIRAVVEAPLDERLSGLALVNSNQLEIEPEGEDPKLAAALDGMF